MVDLLPAGARAYRHLANVRAGASGSRDGAGSTPPTTRRSRPPTRSGSITSRPRTPGTTPRPSPSTSASYSEQQDRRAAQERARLAYKEWSRAERLKAEEERQARLAASRATERKRMDLDAAQADVWDLRPKARLAMRTVREHGLYAGRQCFLDVSRRGKQNYEYASTNRGIGRKWAQGVAERYAAALARAEEVLEGVTAGRHPYPWDESNLAHAWRPAVTIWSPDVPEDGTDEAERVTLLRIASETYDGPVNRKGHPRLRPFREHAGMPDATRAEIRQAALSRTQTPKENTA